MARAIELDNEAERIMPAEATVQDEKQATRTDELKARLTHKPVAPVEDQLTEEEKEAILAAEAAEAADEMR